MKIPARILILVGSTTAAALALTLGSWAGPVDARFWFWCVACLAGELLWVRMPVGRVTVSMASCFQFAALLVLPGAQAMTIAALTGLVAEVAVLRKPAIRALFNAAQAALAVGAARAVLEALGGAAAGALPVGALLAAGVAYFAVNTGAVSLAVALHERIDPRRAWWSNFGTGYELVSNGALFSLGALLASLYVAQGPAGALLVALPVVVAFQGYRAMVESRTGRSRPDAALRLDPPGGPGLDAWKQAAG